jgi:hypothetical protein
MLVSPHLIPTVQNIIYKIMNITNPSWTIKIVMHKFDKTSRTLFSSLDNISSLSFFLLLWNRYNSFLLKKPN